MDLPAAMVGVRSFIEEELTHLEAEESCSELIGQFERRWRLENLQIRDSRFLYSARWEKNLCSSIVAVVYVCHCPRYR